MYKILNGALCAHGMIFNDNMLILNVLSTPWGMFELIEYSCRRVMVHNRTTWMNLVTLRVLPQVVSGSFPCHCNLWLGHWWSKPIKFHKVALWKCLSRMVTVQSFVRILKHSGVFFPPVTCMHVPIRDVLLPSTTASNVHFYVWHDWLISAENLLSSVHTLTWIIHLWSPGLS